MHGVLAARERGDVDQLGADAQRGGARGDEFARGLRVHAAGRQHLHVGQRAASAPCRYFAPPTAEAGKIFTMSAPAFQAVITSVGVSAPGMIGTPRACAAAMVAEVQARADDERGAGLDAGLRAASASSTVPAPTTRAVAEPRRPAPG